MAVADPHAALTAYLLGELDDGRRREFEAHLEGCAACRADVAELAPTIEHGRDALPGPGAPPDGLVDSTLARVDPGRRAGPAKGSGGPARTPVLVGAGAAAVLVIAAIIAIASGGGGEEERAVSDAETPGARAPAPELRAELTGSAGRATIEIDEVDSGRSISLSADELPPLEGSGFYELWLVSGSDTRERPVRVSAGSFKPAEEGPTEATMSVGVTPARFDRIEVTREGDRLPNAGGDVVLRLETKGLIQLG